MTLRETTWSNIFDFMQDCFELAQERAFANPKIFCFM